MSADLGTFAVSAEPAEVAAFCDAARLEAADSLPFTWPIRWLALPRVRAAAMALVPESDLVPFHESQTFDYAAPLEVGVAYTLAVTARRENGPERLVVEGRVVADGATLATIETVLRLFSTQAQPHG